MDDLVTAKTASRSLVGVLNEFIFLAGHHRAGKPELDLQSLSMDLARTPMSPLYKGHISPDRELAALRRPAVPANRFAPAIRDVIRDTTRDVPDQHSRAWTPF